MKAEELQPNKHADFPGETLEDIHGSPSLTTLDLSSTGICNVPEKVGGVNAGRGPYCSAPVKDWADKADKLQQAALQSWLGIPLIPGVDAIHGHNNVYGTTIFRHNVVKDLRWNRCYESYSEVPEIVGKMPSIITSLQGLPPAEHPKGHPFVTGSISQHVCTVMASFSSYNGQKGSISQHVCTVMASFSSYNGQKMHSNKFLLTDVLKNKLGFKGFVISDWEGIDKLKENKDPEGADYRVLGPHDVIKFHDDLMSLVEAGEVPISRIDDAVERIRVKFAAGIFGPPLSDRSLLDLVGCKMILVINVGPGVYTGSETVAGQQLAYTELRPSFLLQSYNWTTILDAIKQTVAPETEVILQLNKQLWGYRYRKHSCCRTDVPLLL
ncbi:hypothetical protein CDL15_Pgr015808 [Punica granatum]|uniref:Glycoside hydrolase family 3 N-terminal domain-containing protein n=1 Tax=Punica granatum TaxID=22663 RepID=A0A218XR80_PUNGR|nr:hypothetical protein CDL15_Pgr015808 [Punica granatum]